MPEVLLDHLGNERAKILVIDDEPINTEILAFSLENDYLIKCVHSGAEAFKALTQFLPDLILLDIRMPGMDGYEVLHQLKLNPITEKIPVIFVTGEGSTDDELKGLQLGAVDYVRKPFKIPLVLARVAIHVDLKRKSDILESLASADGLTGISNRRKFDESLESLYQSALRNKSSLGLVIMDIDYFKQYNDIYGHACGDDCLKRVALVLAEIAKRATDVVARVGGEEFALILPNVNKTQLKALTDAVHTELEKKAIKHSGSQVSEYVTVSIGATSFIPDTVDGTQALYKHTDELLYQAKAAGRATTIID